MSKQKFIFKDRQSRTYQQTFSEPIKRKNKTLNESKKSMEIIKRRVTLAQREKCQMVTIYTWKQHQSSYNSEPAYLNNEIAKKLISYLNDYEQNYRITVNKVK